MNSLNIDKGAKKTKLRYLLHLLSLGKLSREDASELKPLLMEELKETETKRYRM
jgi:hypothetical protein